VHHAGVWIEPDGQTVLDFRLAPANAEDVAPIERPEDAPERRCEIALEWFERGCQLDAEPATFDQAIEAYKRAVEADPEFADAHCNLGTVYYHQGLRDAAQACFEHAMALDASHVEARFNLANLLEEKNQDQSALAQYKAVIGVDPSFADAHLNLALLYEKLGLPRSARGCWRRYLGLEPAGAWAEVARQRLEGGREAP
jgi:tetratricopeptide (TPR) repeat protein